MLQLFEVIVVGLHRRLWIPQAAVQQCYSFHTLGQKDARQRQRTYRTKRPGMLWPKGVSSGLEIQYGLDCFPGHCSGTRFSLDVSGHCLSFVDIVSYGQWCSDPVFLMHLALSRLYSQWLYSVCQISSLLVLCTVIDLTPEWSSRLWHTRPRGNSYCSNFFSLFNFFNSCCFNCLGLWTWLDECFCELVHVRFGLVSLTEGRPARTFGTQAASSQKKGLDCFPGGPEGCRSGAWVEFLGPF